MKKTGQKKTAGRILGYNMKVYDGSMQEWSRLANLPMEKTKKD